jgi:hypothetical protein
MVKFKIHGLTSIDAAPGAGGFVLQLNLLKETVPLS